MVGDWKRPQGAVSTMTLTLLYDPDLQCDQGCDCNTQLQHPGTPSKHQDTNVPESMICRSELQYECFSCTLKFKYPCPKNSRVVE